MKLEETLKEKNVEQIKDDKSEDIDFGIDKEDEWIIFQSFTNYSNPLASIVREITSNCFDAHIEAGVDKEVIISIIDENHLTGTSNMISFRDFGDGMSPDIIRNIYSRFGKSTKRDRNDAIGAFGFGAKSPLAYQDMFELITIHNGTKYHYAVHSGEKKPKITLMVSDETDEPSGTEVRMVIKDGDKSRVKDAIKQQLKYFDNITYKNCGINNDYTIVEGKHFKFRVNKHDPSGSKYKKLHMCIGNVYYPIDNSLLSTPNIDIALKFDIGEIPVVWNRENVNYNDRETVEKIERKRKLAQDELQSIIDRRYADIDTIEKFINFKDDRSGLVLHEEGDQKYYLNTSGSSFLSTKKVYPKYDHLKINNPNSLLNHYNIVKTLNTGWSSKYNPDPDEHQFILLDKGRTYTNLQQEYADDKFDSYKIWRKTDKKHAIRQILSTFCSREAVYNPYSFKKKERQARIEEAYQLYDEITEYMDNNSIHIDDLNIPQDFIDNYEAEKEAEKKRKKEIFHYLKVKRQGSFSRFRINGNKLISKFGKETVIYGFQDDRKALREVKRIIYKELTYRRQGYVNIIQISMKNERVVREVLPDTAFHVDNVMKTRVFRKISNKYNKKNYYNKLRKLIDELEDPNKYGEDNIPGYIDPDEPTLTERNSVLKQVGEELKYPLEQYISPTAPDHLVKTYKEKCELYPINPILIAKKYIKHYENQCTEE